MMTWWCHDDAMMMPWWCHDFFWGYAHSRDAFACLHNLWTHRHWVALLFYSFGGLWHGKHRWASASHLLALLAPPHLLLCTPWFVQIQCPHLPDGHALRQRALWKALARPFLAHFVAPARLFPQCVWHIVACFGLCYALMRDYFYFFILKNWFWICFHFLQPYSLCHAHSWFGSASLCCYAKNGKRTFVEVGASWHRHSTNALIKMHW